MAKLDEIAELLTEEIHDFKKSVTHLERVHEQIKKLQLRPDTTEINTLLKEYGNRQVRTMDEQHKQAQAILGKVEQSLLLPNWAVKLAWGLLVCILLMLGFSIYRVSGTSKMEEAAFIKGRESAMEHFGAFLEASPQANEHYQKWLEDNSKK
ncbi:DUF6730 family protein [Flagellimonas okinawensis]|uniref:Uncharacterized protein n=1 Tax=Flagellimonas okinawensis TaxID=3031324 RepID=A0ABT5XPD7_9FLAO|nr:DUF6730 family protein [[Muricauda] okinawensis]MDF0707759.1 hypothetical protein [[Muricauda] okinawensis]